MIGHSESSRPGLPLADIVIPQEDLQDQPALFESTLGPAPEQIKLSEPELPTLFFGCPPMPFRQACASRSRTSATH